MFKVKAIKAAALAAAPATDSKGVPAKKKIDNEEEYVRSYRPLDVRTWAEGYWATAGWLNITIMAVIAGVLLSMYEVRHPDPPPPTHPPTTTTTTTT